MKPKNARTNFEPEYKVVRAVVLGRDRGCCTKCGSKLALEVHHIEGHKHNEPELLSTLCYLCHGIAPMGKIAFNEWMMHGKSGIEALGDRLTKNGLRNLKPEDILVFCNTLNEFGYELRTSQLRKARERTKLVEGKCEGRKSYGDYPGEGPVLAEIIEMSRSGTSGEAIAAGLNLRGILSRGGKRWRGSTIRKIVVRKLRISTQEAGITKAESIRTKSETGPR